MAILSAAFGMIPEEESYFYIAKLNYKKRNDLVRAAVLDAKRIFAHSVALIGIIYNLKYGNKKINKPFFHAKKSWGENLAFTMGLPINFSSHLEKIGLVHIAQGKGNASSHISYLVSTIGADPYKCISSCIIALSAPEHAKASVDALILIEKIIAEYGENATTSEIQTFIINWLKQGKKIPGVGQAVMKKSDPRFFELYESSENTPKIRIAHAIGLILPGALKAANITLNSPYPNINLILGGFAENLGIYEKDFLPMLFTSGRIIDPLSQFIESTIWNPAILRPSSLTSKDLLTLANKSRKT